ncbi:MAG: monovalent cation:proton antiporter-2 (CPA2) family protein, partial [Aestuariivirga sp.]
ILAFCAGAVVAVPLFRRFGLSAVLGYLAAGVVIGPSLLAVVKDPDTIRGTAEIGVVLLLFIVGLELQPSRLIAMRKDIFGAGTAQLLLTAAVFGGIGYGLGLSPAGAFAVGVSFALSATSIALQMLDERNDASEHYGRRTFAILLFQDLSIAPILALLPILAASGAADGGMTGAAKGIGLAVAAIAAVVLIGRYALNPFFALLARSGAREVMTAAALLVVLGAAMLMELAGLSMAMGAFMAGVMLAESRFRHELEADIEPFRGVLLGLFFMAVGMSLDLALLRDNALTLLGAAFVLIAVKILIAGAILRASCSSTREALRAGALLSPAGEFAFVLIPLAASLAVLTPAQSGYVTALAALTMLIGPIAAKLLETWLAPRAGATEAVEEDFNGAGGSVMVIGFGRFGQVVTQTMLARQVEVTVIDRDVERIRSAARFGFKIYFGDGTRLDVLRAAGAAKARVIAVCVDDKAAATKIAEIAAHEFAQARIHVRAFDRVHAIELMAHEPDRVVRELFEGALDFGGGMLEALGLTADEALEAVADVRERDLTRLKAQAQEGLLARADLIHRQPGVALPAELKPMVTPEPLSKPKSKPKALTPETQQIIAAEQPRPAGVAS